MFWDRFNAFFARHFGGQRTYFQSTTVRRKYVNDKLVEEEIVIEDGDPQAASAQATARAEKLDRAFRKMDEVFKEMFE